MGEERFKEMGGMKEALRFPLDDLHLIAGEGAPAYARVRRQNGKDSMFVYNT